jgi:predicted  nucleic acid-binding Zn-ribbon protein
MTDDQFDKLARLIKEARTGLIEHIDGSVAHLVAHMATKEDLADLRLEMKEDLAGLRRDLKGDIAHMATKEGLAELRAELHSSVADINDQLANISGFRKEIDHVLDRTVRIEKHLGIKHKIAA